MAADDSPFLARWSRRKALAREGVVAPEPPAAPALPAIAPESPSGPPLPAAPAAAAPAAAVAGAGSAEAAAAAPAPPPPPPPPPTLDDVALLTPASDFARFVARDVPSDVKNAALKKLFADPHFNVMDGLDTYIDDYGRPDPLPLSMLKQLRQANFLGLLDDDDKEAANGHAGTRPPADTPPAPAAAVTAAADPPPARPDEDPDLRLQPDDAAGPAGDRPRAGEDPAGQP